MGKSGRPKKDEDALLLMLNDDERPINSAFRPILQEARRRGWTFAQLCREAQRDAANLKASFCAKERVNMATLESVLGALKFPERALLARALRAKLEPEDVRDILERRLPRDIDGQLVRLFEPRIHNALREFLTGLSDDARAGFARRYVLALHDIDEGERDTLFPSKVFGTVENVLKTLKAAFSLRDFLVDGAFNERREAIIDAYMNLRTVAGLSDEETRLLGWMLHSRITNPTDPRLIAALSVLMNAYRVTKAQLENSAGAKKNKQK